MKKFIKVLSLLLVAIMLFTACSKNNEKVVVVDPPKDDENVDDGINTDNIVNYIIKDKKSEYKIVYSSKGTSAEQYSARELNKFFLETTGVNVRLMLDNNIIFNKKDKYISIGNTSLLEQAQLNFDYSQLNVDGFFVKNVGNMLFIDGENDRGTIYGVYDLIEKLLGVRFINNDCTYIPKVEDVPLYEIDIVEAPAFEYRNVFATGIMTDEVFYARSRMNAPEVRFVNEMYGGSTDWYTDINTVHNAFDYVSDDIYYSKHPEYFAVDKDGNTITDFVGNICQLCLTNGVTDDAKLDVTKQESVVTIALATLKKMILSNEHANVFFFGENDWEVHCECSRCTKASKENGGQSGVLIRFINILSAEINKWVIEQNLDRKITIATFAYLQTKLAPVKEVDGKTVPVNSTVIPGENVYIRVAPIELNWYYSINDEKQKQEYKKIVEDWTHVTNRLMIWTYETNFSKYLWYFPSMRQWSENLKYFKDIGVRYTMMQDNYNGYGSWQAGIHTYVASKLLWNPNLKVQPLIDEYLKCYYKDASVDVSAMMNLFDEHYAILAKTEPDWWMPFVDRESENMQNSRFYPIKLLRNAEKIILNAIDKINNNSKLSSDEKNTIILRLKAVLLTPQQMILHNYNDYYSEGLKEFAIDFFNNAEAAKVRNVSEVESLINYKTMFI